MPSRFTARLLLLPGTGDVTTPDCGVGAWTRTYKCTENDDHPLFKVTGKSCGRPACPACWQTWCKRGADRIADRVYALRELKPTIGYARHIVFSLDDIAPNLHFAQNLEEMIPAWRDELREMALAAGVKAGALIFHLYRLNGHGKLLYREYYRDGGDKRVWEWLRGQVNWRELVIVSPHAHVIGYGWLAENGPEKGFMYKNVRSLNAREEIEKTAFYALSHAPITKGHAVIYFGQLAYNKLKRISVNVEWVRVTCPTCGARMVGTWCSPGAEQEPYVKQIRGVYELKPDG